MMNWIFQAFNQLASDQTILLFLFTLQKSPKLGYHQTKYLKRNLLATTKTACGIPWSGVLFQTIS